MPAHPNSFDTTTANFARDVIEASRRAPVLVDFWAPWCGPCRALTPILEKLAAEFEGKFVLVKINTDEHPEVAAQYGVRGIPNVKAFVGGAPVDEFVGALPESAVREFLARVLPSPGDALRRQAREDVTRGDFDAAESKLREALALDERDEAAALDLAELLVARQDFAGADPLVERIPEALRDDRAQQLAAKIAFGRKGETLPSVAELAARVAATPDDADARLALAERLVAEGSYAAALDELLEVVRRDRAERREAAREAMVKVFRLAADRADLVADYRRRLAAELN
ncbi:MAG: thioredoxin [Burkholderiales bacterium]|nr:thioredoxin [Burkholderiales bacterium]